MEPINWFMKVVTEHYFDFTGRARRAEYWWYTLVYIIIAIVLGVIQNILHLGNLLSGLFGLAMLLPSLGVGVRRLHDIGRSGWWLLLVFIPIVGWIVLLYWYVQPGNAGANAFGADPKA